jgi:hypothetical protein
MLRDWFDDWLHDHLSMHAENYRLPAAGSDAALPLYEAWRKEMLRAGVLELEDARAASRYLVVDAPHPNQHFKRFLKLAEAARLERLGDDAPTKSDGSDRDRAFRESRECPDCSGDGRTRRYHHKWPRPMGTPEEVLFYCTCPMGAWMKNAHRLGPDRRPYYPDLRDHPALQLGPVEWSEEPDNKHRYSLSLWDAEKGVPIEKPYVPSVEDLSKRVTRPPPERHQSRAWEPSPAPMPITVQSLPDAPF